VKTKTKTEYKCLAESAYYQAISHDMRFARVMSNDIKFAFVVHVRMPSCQDKIEVFDNQEQARKYFEDFIEEIYDDIKYEGHSPKDLEKLDENHYYYNGSLSDITSIKIQGKITSPKF
jgi:hypothetical protein|tara:strand:- start:1042 stop:1395 length:354 start_codon:yes stop_codon:yes gene_type:complete